MTPIGRASVVAADGATPIARREARVVEVVPEPIYQLERAARVARDRATIVDLAAEIATRLVGDAVARDDRALVSLFDEARAALGPSSSLVAHLSPSDAARLSARFAGLGVRVAIDDARAPGSMRVDGERGSSEVSVEDAVRRLADAIELP